MSSNAERSNSTISEIKSLIIVIFIALLFRTFVIELFFVPTGSMKSTILEGDYVFSTKYSYGYSKYSFLFEPDLFSGRIFAATPKRGDIVIIKSAHNMSTRFIKRLIGMPGEKIQIIDDIIYINDEPIKRRKVGIFKFENSKNYIKFREALPEGKAYYVYKLSSPESVDPSEYSNYGPYYVPEGHFFFMGDNRDESGDSRAQIGFVPFEFLIARASHVVFSTKEFLWKSELGFIDQIQRVSVWLKSIRFNRMLHKLK